MSMTEGPKGAPSFFFFERTDSDFPYYRGVPVAIGPLGWLIVLASVALGFFVLLKTQPLFHSGIAGFIPGLLFVLIPLGALAAVGGTRAPGALFRRIRASDAGLAVGFFLINAVLTVAVGILVTSLFHTAANPASEMVASAEGADRVLFFAWSAVQLLGEEIFTILILLAVFAGLDRVVSRKAALCGGVLVASVVFACIHLPTYQWNVAQAFLGLVPVRIILLMPFIITRNIWASAGAHILNDWAIFALAAAAGMDAA